MSKVNPAGYYEALNSISSVIKTSINELDQESTSFFLSRLTDRLTLQFDLINSNQQKFENLFLKKIGIRNGRGSVSLYQASLKQLVDIGILLFPKVDILTLLDLSYYLNERLSELAKTWVEAEKVKSDFYRQRIIEFLNWTFELRFKSLTTPNLKNNNYSFVFGWYNKIVFDSDFIIHEDQLKYYNEQLKLIFNRAFDHEKIEYDNILDHWFHGGFKRYSSPYNDWSELMIIIGQENSEIEVFDRQLMNLQMDFRNVCSYKEMSQALDSLDELLKERNLRLSVENRKKFEVNLFRSVAFYYFQETLIHIAAIALVKKQYKFYSALMYGSRVDTNVSVSFEQDIMPLNNNFNRILVRYYDIKNTDHFDLGSVDKDLFIDVVYSIIVYLRWRFYFTEGQFLLIPLDVNDPNISIADIDTATKVMNRILKIYDEKGTWIEELLNKLDNRIHPSEPEKKHLVQRINLEMGRLVDSGNRVIEDAPLLVESIYQLRKILRKRFKTNEPEITLYRDLGLLNRKLRKREEIKNEKPILVDEFYERSLFINEKFSKSSMERNLNNPVNLLIINWSIKLITIWQQRFFNYESEILEESSLVQSVMSNLFKGCILIGVNYNFYNFDVEYNRDSNSSLIGKLKKTGTQLGYMKLMNRDRFILISNKDELGKLYIPSTPSFKYEDTRELRKRGVIKLTLSANAKFDFDKPLNKTKLFVIRDRYA